MRTETFLSENTKITCIQSPITWPPREGFNLYNCDLVDCFESHIRKKMMQFMMGSFLGKRQCYIILSELMYFYTNEDNDARTTF